MRPKLGGDSPLLQGIVSISRGALLDHPVQGLMIPLLTWEMWKLIMILLLLPTDAPFIAVPLQCQAEHTLHCWIVPAAALTALCHRSPCLLTPRGLKR